MAYPRPGVYQDEERRKLQRFLAKFGGTPRNVLDVGCGTALPLDFPPTVHLVGLDIAREALAANKGLDEAIVADIETDPLSAEAYDAIICWNVLEHLASPRAALANMAGALRPGGLLIVGVPNPWSLKGLVTKLTPYRFHRWAYRHVFGHKELQPFRTYLRRDVGPERLARRAKEQGLKRIYASTYGPAYPLPRALAIVWSSLAEIIRIVTLARWEPEASEHIAVFRKLD